MRKGRELVSKFLLKAKKNVLPSAVSVFWETR